MLQDSAKAMSNAYFLDSRASFKILDDNGFCEVVKV